MLSGLQPVKILELHAETPNEHEVLPPIGRPFRAHDRLVNTLDGERFSTYSQHLRDMYNFDPSAVEQFLKEMRVLAANGHNAAYGMRAKVGAKGLVNGIAASPRTECAAATVSENQGSVTVYGAEVDGGDAVEESSRRAQTRQAKLRKSLVFSMLIPFYQPSCACSTWSDGKHGTMHCVTCCLSLVLRLRRRTERNTPF